MWWRDGVIYQISPRSFQDSDGDGVGDLRGIERRLDHVVALGVGAIWLSPVYPSPLADFGYDVADFEESIPSSAPSRTSTASSTTRTPGAWRCSWTSCPAIRPSSTRGFASTRTRYVRREGPEPPNNWIASFGGPAWSRDPLRGGWYLHSFYPEQPDLDWRNDDVVAARQGVVRFWIDRGVDGFRLDALDRLLKDPELRDDPPATGPPALPLHGEHGTLDHVHSRDADDIGTAVAALREAAGDKLLVGEVYLPTAQLHPYLEHLDVAFCFELFHARWEAEALRTAIESALAASSAPSCASSRAPRQTFSPTNAGITSSPSTSPTSRGKAREAVASCWRPTPATRAARWPRTAGGSAAGSAGLWRMPPGRDAAP